jgi:hypothetical protein
MASVQIRSNLRSGAARLHSASALVPRELNAAAMRTLRPLQTKLKGSALRTLPRRGGLNRAVAFDLRFTTRQLATGARLTANSQYNLQGLDEGETVHPLFGNRGHWYSESVTPGWWTRVVDTLDPDVRREFGQGINKIVREAGG